MVTSRGGLFPLLDACRDADEAQHTLQGRQVALERAAACLTAKTQDAQSERKDFSGRVEQLVSAFFWLYRAVVCGSSSLSLLCHGTTLQYNAVL